ncbi:MAG: hypothetical protein M4579_000248 [Chaenotheca gracillima]|nr:MAG: hypothetical protein M4579_000248 [Chaenotheca gracillima]
MSQREQVKAAHYIGLLDSARCNGSWQDVPELVRKVNKHAPHRKCLTLTAQSEYQVATYSRTETNVPSPLASLIPPLLSAIDSNAARQDEVFQAQLCLGWIHWKLAEPSLAISRLPRGLEQAVQNIAEVASDSPGWMKVCSMKGIFIKGDSLDKTVGAAQAVDSLTAAVLLAARTPYSAAGPELRLWTERLLTRGCLLSSDLAFSARDQSVDTKALILFRAWSHYWEGKPGQGLALLGGSSAISPIPRRLVWKSYYALLSRRLEDDFPHMQLSLQSDNQLQNVSESRNDPVSFQSRRLQQRAELQRVEATYEGLLMKEVQFPRASQTSREVEQWVELVISNWRILCGGAWGDEDLGEGGREAVGKSVIDILYRAATKTFHSTSILRHLFAVHLSLADLDLAYRALDSYLELITKAKARAEKTGEYEPSMDSNDLIFWTASEGINALCRFGGRRDVERARDIGVILEEWLLQHDSKPDPSTGWFENDQALSESRLSDPRFSVSSEAKSAAYRAIGVSQAQWARLTYDSSARTDLQMAATTTLRVSLTVGPAESVNVDSLFALALLLAERRQLNAAIDVVRQALLPHSQKQIAHLTEAADEVDSGARSLFGQASSFSKERKLLPLWHLLALLLSAKQEFLTASKACEAAFEQFRDPSNLFGSEDAKSTPKSEHLKAAFPSSASTNEKNRHTRGIVDRMDDHEKETILEIKMTQIALLEISEGPDYAVNAADELLALYVRLFGDPRVAAPKPLAASMQIARPPKSSSGTIKSIGGSLFGRSKGSKRGLHPRNQPLPPAASIVEEPSGDLRRAPTIEVSQTDGDKKTIHDPNSLHHSGSHRGEKLVKKNGPLGSKKSSRSLRQKKQTESLSEKTTNTRPGTMETSGVNGDAHQRQTTSHAPGDVHGSSNHQPRTQGVGDPSLSSQVGIAVSPDMTSPAPSAIPDQRSVQSSAQPLPNIAHNMPLRLQPPPTGHSRQPPQQDVRLPHVNPYTSSTQPQPLFNREHHRRRISAVLVKVWLLIAGLYRRAHIYDDANGAIEEAAKLVSSLEREATRDSLNARLLDDPGWGGGKSVEQIWADVWAERGTLLLAKSSRQDALESFEQALSRFPDHPQATVGLCNTLLDIATENTAESSTASAFTSKTASAEGETREGPVSDQPGGRDLSYQNSSDNYSDEINGNILESPSRTTPTRTSPQELDRLAARDRAYGLLASLTKLGVGWDYSEAWFALARAYEESGQVGKARDVLWWCVELEDGRPIRHWRNVGTGGYVL